MKSNIRTILGLAIVLALTGLLLEGVYFYINSPEIIDIPEVIEKDPIVKELPEVLPESLTLDVPFVCQAPLGNWGYPFDHACEEAAILMIHYYFQDKLIDPAVAAEEIEEIVNFEMEKYGFHEDTSAEQTAQLIRDYYGYKAEVIYDTSLEDIKRELSKGNPVIVPTAGRMLENPYFTPPGPRLHMLVIKGYSLTGFIVNDPGTKRGEDYIYSYEILEEAIHDWGEGDVEEGRSAMIIVYED